MTIEKMSAKDFFYSLPSISEEEYNKIPALRNTTISNILEYDVLYKKIKRKETDAMDVGSAVHCKITEPNFFEDRFVISHFDSFRTDESKKWLNIQRENKKTVLTEKEFESVSKMEMSVKSHVKFGDFTKGKSEVSITFELFGELFKARLDHVRFFDSGAIFIVDIKTTKALTADDISKEAGMFGHHRQAYIYKLGFIKFMLDNGYAISENDVHIVHVYATKPSDLIEESQCVAYAIQEEDFKKAEIEVMKAMRIYSLVEEMEAQGFVTIEKAELIRQKESGLIKESSVIPSLSIGFSKHFYNETKAI